MRLFLGIELPEELKRFIALQLAPVQTAAKGWEQRHDYHLTLLFIGASSTETKDDVVRRMEKIRPAPFTLETGAYDFFPKRILFLGLRYSHELLRLKELVDNEFTEWVNPRSPPFRPHVTVKRYQRYEHADLQERLRHVPEASFSFAVSHLTLFQSEKNLSQEKYHVLHRQGFA